MKETEHLASTDDKTIAKLDENGLVVAINGELNRKDRAPRMWLLTRLLGRLNRLRGSRLTLDVLASANKKGRKDVRALLANNR